MRERWLALWLRFACAQDSGRGQRRVSLPRARQRREGSLSVLVPFPGPRAPSKVLSTQRHALVCAAVVRARSLAGAAGLDAWHVIRKQPSWTPMVQMFWMKLLTSCWCSINCSSAAL